jgi:hypothetical protein
MLDSGVKKIIDAIIKEYGYKDAMTKYEQAMRNKRYYQEKDEDSIQSVLNYIRTE